MLPEDNITYEILDLMLSKHRHINKHDTESHPSLEERIALYQSAPIFVESTIATAEQQSLKENQLGVSAAIIEARSWILPLTISSIRDEHFQSEDYIPTSTIPGDPISTDDTQNLSMATALGSFSRAKTRLRDATVRHRTSIEYSDDRPHRYITQTWREISATAALGTILDHHVDSIESLLETNLKSAQGHDQASRTIMEILGQMIADRLIQPVHDADDNQLAMNNATQTAIRAMRKFLDTAPHRLKTTPIHVHLSIRSTDDDRPNAEQLARELILSPKQFLIRPNPTEPERILIAYMSGHKAHVKRILDPYHYQVTPYTAIKYAAQLVEESDNTERSYFRHQYIYPNRGEEGTNMNQLAELVYENATAGLHHINEHEFEAFIMAMKTANNDPLAIERAATEVAAHDSPGVNLLFHRSKHRTDVTSEQAARVIEAARQAGLTPGYQRALCTAMMVEPSPMGVPPPSPTTLQVLNVLEKCPLPLHPHQILNLVKTMGLTGKETEIIEWAEANAVFDSEEEGFKSDEDEFGHQSRDEDDNEDEDEFDDEDDDEE